MRRRARSESGFTLIELMLTAAIIGVLSAIAIPNFLAFQARSRRAEATTNVTALARVYKAFFAENDYFPDIFQNDGVFAYPDPLTVGAPSTTKKDWPPAGYAFFDLSGFAADGPFYYQYGVVADAATGCACAPSCFTAYAYGDVDGNGNIGGVIYAHPDGTGAWCSEPANGWNPPPGEFEVAVPVTPGPLADQF